MKCGERFCQNKTAENCSLSLKRSGDRTRRKAEIRVEQGDVRVRTAVLKFRDNWGLCRLFFCMQGISFSPQDPFCLCSNSLDL